MRVFTWEPGPRTPAFWLGLGPFFADAEIRKTMPYLRDIADRYFWASADLASPHERVQHRAVGIGSAHIDPPRKGGDVVGFLHGLYVSPDARGQGVALALVKRRMEWLHGNGANIIRATATEAGASVLRKLGFEAMGNRGAYTKMQLGGAL